MKLLITGAAGHIGRALRGGLADRYDLIRLADIAAQSPAGPGEKCIRADLADINAAITACEGIDCVVHLVGIPLEPAENAWEQLLPVNIVSTYNVFEGARRAGVRRIVYASSNHVVGFYRREQVAGPDALPRPDTLYGVSKVFGEALGRLYADKHGMSVACLRIGSFRQAPEDRRQLATWISPGDTVQLFQRAIEAPDFHFFTAYGVSDNEGTLWSNEGLEWFGYAPQDRSDPNAPAMRNAPKETSLSKMFHGGSYCEQGFTGDPARID